jgi:hypothetical protein
VYTKPMDEFGQFVNNKTIAIVGPAVAPYDQSAEVEAHDIVCRISYRHDLNKPTPGYGERTDVVFYNAEAARKYMLGVYDSFIDNIHWILLKKHRPVKTPLRDMSRDKTITIRPPFAKANQLPIALNFFLRKCEPAKITVFGADLYIDGHATAYHNNYLDRTPERDWWGIDFHEPYLQHRFMKVLVNRNAHTVAGDTRFLNALNLNTDEYMEHLKRNWANGRI